MAQHHPQLKRQLQKWVVSLHRASWLGCDPDQNNIVAHFVWWWPWQMRLTSSCKLWIMIGVSTSDLRRPKSDWDLVSEADTLGSHSPSHPEAGCWEPSSHSKRSARYHHNQLLVMNTGHQRCIQANERALLGPRHPIGRQEFCNSFLMACDRWYVATESRMWIPRLQSREVRTLYSN